MKNIFFQIFVQVLKLVFFLKIWILLIAKKSYAQKSGLDTHPLIPPFVESC